MVAKLRLVGRTLRHLKLIQVVNRIWRKRPIGDVSREGLPVRGGGGLVAFPCGYSVWDGKTRFTFLNETHEVKFAADWNNQEWKKLWLYNLHYFDCLRQEGVGGMGEPSARAPTGRNGAPTGRKESQALIERWIAENPVGKGNGWEPYPISLRVVNWIKWMVRVEDGADGVRALPSLAVQVRWLWKRLEYHLLANHLLANAKALVFAGRFFEGEEAEEWYRKGMAIYRKELPEQVLADGVHFERSAMYHLILLEDVLDCYNFTGEEIFKTYAAKMLGALRLLVGPDGKIVKFNDAAEGIALPVERVREYAKRLGIESEGTVRAVEPEARPYRGARQSGFVRLEKGEICVIAKMGEIGPSYQPGHAHADTGTFEMWKGARKIITDTGTDRYVVDDERKRQRGTSAHNCVMVDGRNSSEVWAGHRVARRAQSLEIGKYRDCRGFEIVRRLEVTDHGLMGKDEIKGRGEHEVEVRWHLAPGVSADEVRVACRMGGEAVDCVTESCLICAEFGRADRSVVVIARKRVRLPVVIGWNVFC